MTTHLFTANGGDGRRIFLAKVQGAEGTIDSLTAGTHEKLYEAGSYLKPMRETLTPDVVSPSNQGSAVWTTNEHVEVDITSRIFPTTISSADSTDVPHPSELLVTSGWELVSDSTDKTHSYVLTANQGSLLSAKVVKINANNTATRSIHAGDIRGSVIISARYGQPWTINYKGLGRNNDPTNIRSYDANPYTTVPANLPSSDYPPLMMKGSTLYLYDQTGTALYAGGSLSTPGTAGDLLEFSFDSNRVPTARGGASATSGIHGAILEQGRPTLDLTLECNSVDLHYWHSLSKGLQFRIRSPQPQASVNTATLLTFGFITDIGDEEIDEGRYIAKVKIAVGWPADVSDNSPKIGANPLSPWTTASNQGVPLMPATTLPVGMALLQFATAT
jgi:hypothetical protein